MRYTRTHLHKIVFLFILFLSWQPPASSYANAATPPFGPRLIPGWPVIAGYKIGSSLAVADFDGDGRDELAATLRDGRVLLLDSRGRLLPGWPQSTTYWNFYSPLICNLAGRGEYEIIAVSWDERVYAWSKDGAMLPGWPVDCGARPVSSPQHIETTPEAGRCILVFCEDGRVHLLDSRGKNHPGWPRHVGRPTIAFWDFYPVRNADLDGDGIPEILLLTYKEAFLHVLSVTNDDYPGFPIQLGEDGFGVTLDDYESPTRIACTTRKDIIVLDLSGAEIFRHKLPAGDAFVTAPAFIVSGRATESEVDLLITGTQKGMVYAWEKDWRVRDGWPVRLSGFIYGLTGTNESFAIEAAPTAWDVDGDGELEILVSSTDQHLYCIELDGSPTRGWPLLLDDWVVGAPVFAQLDGTGSKELVIGQSGESIFAFSLEPHGETPVNAGLREPPLYGSKEWPRHYFAVAIIILLLVIILFVRLRADLRSKTVVFTASTAGWILLAVFIAIATIRGILFIGEFQRYWNEKNRLSATQPLVQGILDDMKEQVKHEAALLAADFESSFTENGGQPIDFLYRLEWLADHHRLDYEYTGLMLTDTSGQAIQSVGLARSWGGLTDLGLDMDGATEPILMENVPVFVGVAPLSKRNAQRFLVLFSSLLNDLPHKLAETTGSSVHLRLNGRTLAWGGASPLPTPSFHPWLGILEPSQEIPLALESQEHRLSLLFAVEDCEEAAGKWLDLCLVLLLPVLSVFMISRRDIHRARSGVWWLASFTAVYFIGFLVFARGYLIQRPVSLSGQSLEFLLHMMGLLGLVVITRTFWSVRSGTRLSLAVLFSYLIVAIIPLALVLVITTNLLQQAQRKVIRDSISGLEKRADHLVMAHLSKVDFMSGILENSPQLLSRTPEMRYYNFVGENELLFTYELPSAYLTLWVQDRTDPGLHFTGFSWRAPRTDKFFPRLPEWMDGGNQSGIFLDGGKTVIRATRATRFKGLDIQLVSHIPLDRTILDDLEERLRILPFFPRVRLQPAWYEPEGSLNRSLGWNLPLRTTQVLATRDWNTGAPRWIAYRASAYLPAGREKWTILAAIGFLVILPLGLSAWGAYYTFKRTVQPLTRLLTGIRRVEKGDLEYRLSDSGRTEIALSARAFDRMAESLEANVRELAEKKKIEEVSALKSRFISMISHDLKTPLASIKGATENLLEQLAGPVTEKQKAYLEMILASSKNLQQMIADILDLSHIESGRLVLALEKLDLQRETENALRSIQAVLEEKRIHTRITKVTENTAVRADRSRLWQIINNVFSNAIRYSPLGGVIDITIGEQPAHPSTAYTRFVRMTITDQGPGVPENEQERLFEPFYALPAGGGRKHGAGLGLAIVKQLVELHGGQVSLTNSEKGGASLSFTLPVD